MNDYGIMGRLFDGLGLAFPDVLLILIILGALLFAVQDYRIGLLVLFLSTGVFYIWTYTIDYNSGRYLLVFLSSFIMLAISFYSTRNNNTSVI